MSAAAAPLALVPMSDTRRVVATGLLMAATILVVLDQTIATVAMPQMRAALGATPDTISWVLTSYIIAGAVAMPMTGWLTGRFGRTRFFGFCIIGFTVSSAACGLAVSLPMMVVARLIQGFCGAFLMPMSQSFLYDMNEPSKQMRALSLWGVGSMVGPILGPVVGGWLTDTFNWRWVFFINVPIGVIAAIGFFAVMPRFPSVARAFDHVGFILIAIALCSLQLALDRGTQLDWFESPEILVEFGISLAAFWMLIFHLRHTPHPIVLISLFRNRNYACANLIVFFLVAIVLTASAMLPTFFSSLLGYPTSLAGMMMIPRGLSMTVTLLAAPRLMKMVEGRWLVFVGLLFTIIGLRIEASFTLDMGQEMIMLAGVIEGAGTGLAISVLSYCAISSVPAVQRTEASALYALVRGTGTSLSIAIFSALLARNLQINHAEVGAAMADRAVQLSQYFGGAALSQRAASLADVEVTRQAMMIAYVNDFWLMSWALILMMPIILLFSPIRPPDGAHVVASE